jgi:hypothetical protein
MMSIDPLAPQLVQDLLAAQARATAVRDREPGHMLQAVSERPSLERIALLLKRRADTGRGMGRPSRDARLIFRIRPGSLPGGWQGEGEEGRETIQNSEQPHSV